jgi:ribosomal protein S4E
MVSKKLPTAFQDKHIFMNITSLKDGDFCNVIAGTHKGKSGYVRDIHTSKTGQVTITVLQENGVRFKTLAKNVVVKN